MPDKVITLEYQIPCDRCGFPMKPGTNCLVKMDEKYGKAYFVHIQCPSAPAVAAHRNPHPVKPVFNHAFAIA